MSIYVKNSIALHDSGNSNEESNNLKVFCSAMCSNFITRTNFFLCLTIWLNFAAILGCEHFFIKLHVYVHWQNTKKRAIQMENLNCTQLVGCSTKQWLIFWKLVCYTHLFSTDPDRKLSSSYMHSFHITTL